LEKVAKPSPEQCDSAMPVASLFVAVTSNLQGQETKIKRRKRYGIVLRQVLGPHWQVVDSKGTVYDLQKIAIKDNNRCPKP
jgi:hypothetical protein